MSFGYDQTVSPPFPRLPVVVILPESSTRSPALSGLVDSGADATLVPAKQLLAIEAEEIYRARLRSHWGESRMVAVYLVDLDVAGYNLPGIEVIADDITEDVLLGRNVLNRLILLLDGPVGEADVLCAGADLWPIPFALHTPQVSGNQRSWQFGITRLPEPRDGLVERQHILRWDSCHDSVIGSADIAASFAQR